MCLLIYKSLCYVCICIDAAITQERPPAAYLLRVVDVEFYDDALLIVGRGFVDELSLRSGNEGCSPELYATSTTARVGLISNTIDGDDRKTVGNSMSALYCLPGSALSLLFL